MHTNPGNRFSIHDSKQGNDGLMLEKITDLPNICPSNVLANLISVSEKISECAYQSFLQKIARRMVINLNYASWKLNSYKYAIIFF